MDSAVTLSPPTSRARDARSSVLVITLSLEAACRLAADDSASALRIDRRQKIDRPQKTDRPQNTMVCPTWRLMHFFKRVSLYLRTGRTVFRVTKAFFMEPHLRQNGCAPCAPIENWNWNRS